MKKYGKYETRPVAAAAKQPKAKSALLQTYLTSLLCMVLCVAMFLGTSFAWFTSEVQNTGNEIHVGILKADLRHWNKVNNNWASLSSTENAHHKVFSKDLIWEPGTTVFETLRVINEGTLAFNFEITMTGATDVENGEKFATNMKEFGQYFEVWVKTDMDIPANGTLDDVLKDNVWPAYKDLKASGWKQIGKLDEVIAGSKSLHTGVLKSENEKTSHVTIALHMTEQVNDADIMGKKLNIGIKLVAYQTESGTNKIVGSAEELKAALVDQRNILLQKDITLDKTVTMTGGLLDGNGRTITYSGGRNSSNGSVGVVTTSGGTVRNLTVSGGEDGRALYITKLTSDLFVSDCTFSGAYAFNLNSANATEYTLNFTNTTFKSWTSYANVMKHAYFTECTFEAVLKPYGETTLTDCVFNFDKLDISELKDGEKITLTNCIYKGVTIESATITATAGADGNVTVSCDNVLLAISGDFVVLNG